MDNMDLQPILSSIHLFEEFEKFKQKTDVLQAMAQQIIQHHQLPDLPLKIFSDGSNAVFSYGDHLVIKIFPPFHHQQFKSDLLVLQHLQEKLSVNTPHVKHYGEIYDWPYIVMTQLEGTLLETLWEKMDHANKIIIMRELGALIREVHALPMDGLEEIDCYWQQFVEQQIKNCLTQHQTNKLADFLLQQLPHYLESVQQLLPPFTKNVLLTGEYTPMNFLVKQTDGVWHIDGLIDFGDAMLGLAEYDLLGPGAFLIQGDKQLLKEFLLAYGYSSEALTPTLSRQLTVLMLLHKYSNLNVQVRIENWQNKVRNLQDLENLVWGF